MELIKKTLLGFLNLFLIFLLINNLVNSINQYKKGIDFYNQFKNNYEKEKYKNIRLKSEIIKKKSLYELEKTIRNNLNLTKENEYIILLPTPQVSPIFPSPTPIPNYLQWWYVFVKNN